MMMTTIMVAAALVLIAQWSDLVLLLVGAAASSSSPSRDVFALSKWAEQHGVVMHDSLQWKQYDNDDDAAGSDEKSSSSSSSNWGLELKEAGVKPGTTLLKVPRDLVLDANCIRDELKVVYGEEKLQQALQRLGEFDKHSDGFLIFVKLLRCTEDDEWTPYIEALPKKFPEFSAAEKECLPFYAKYAVEYQEAKVKAFCRAAALLGEWKEEELKWAFYAVGSRFWKTVPRSDDEAPNTELVPVGDMFNHREPPNCAISHDGGCVNFVYTGNNADDDDEKNNTDLFITYGQPSNPHRFLAIFGFCPVDDMPYVWSHIAYPNNPFSDNVSEMVFRASDGAVPKIVWDAVLYALLQPSPKEGKPDYTKEQHAKYKKFTMDVLKTHVAKQLEELAALRQKIDAINGGDDTENMDLIRQHNEFLTTVFSRVQEHLESDSVVV